MSSVRTEYYFIALEPEARSEPDTKTRMHSSTTIRVENLGKHYRLGATVDLMRSFREMVAAIPKGFLRSTLRASREV